MGLTKGLSKFLKSKRMSSRSNFSEKKSDLEHVENYLIDFFSIIFFISQKGVGGDTYSPDVLFDRPLALT